MATVVTVLAVGLALAAATGPWGDPPRVNVVLVSIDTLRADHLGCYGYGPPTSPWIDAFSQEALLYEETIAAAPSTLASHASMLTSLVVPHHGASIARGTGLASAHLTLAEVLREHGYATASWNGGGQLDELYQLDQGFELYQSALRRTRPSSTPSVDRLDQAVTKGLEWIDGLAFGRPFFLFLHSYEVHSPYVPDPELRALFGRAETRLTDAVLGEDLERFRSGEWTVEPGDLQHVIACYDAEIRSADQAFGRLVDSLKERELLDSTVVVLTSDHGEEFGEHGVVGWHSHTLFDELLRVPFLVRPPGGHPWGERVRHQVAGIDLAPTILDAVGIDAPPVFEGRSVLELSGTMAPIPERPVLSARDLDPLRTKRRLHRIALRSGGWKWIAEDRYRRRDQEWQWIKGGRLLDLRRDPGETKDVRKVRPENRARERAMRGRAARWEVARRPVTEQVTPPSDLLNQLRALGYMR